MSLHTDKQGRTWNVLEREDGSISVYYTRPGVGAHMVVYDSSDALQPSPAPAAWMPIASAPKDGSKVDLWTTDRDGLSGRWADCEYDDDDDEWFFWDSDGIKVYLKSEDFSITHWQPLPAPPPADEVCECGGTGSIPRGLDMWDRMNGEEIPCPKCTGKAAEVDHGN